MSGWKSNQKDWIKTRKSVFRDLQDKGQKSSPATTTPLPPPLSPLAIHHVYSVDMSALTLIN